MMQVVIFELLTKLTIITACLAVFLRTRKLYLISYQKGILYFSNAFLFYIISFSSMLLEVILPSQRIVLSFLAMTSAFLGGFYLAYSLVWRHFEQDRIKRSHPLRVIAVIVIASIVAMLELMLVLLYGFTNHYIFFFLILSMLLYAINHSTCRHNRDQSPFISLIGVAVVVYFLMFLEGLLSDVLPTIYYYVWGLITIFFVAVKHNVELLTR